MGYNLPEECQNIECLIHLACNNLSKKSDLNNSDIDFLGTKIILNNIKKFRKNGQKIKFIFLSSQSSSKNALSLYGKSKYKIEKLINFKDDIIIRPGLVYSNKKKGRSIFDYFDNNDDGEIFADLETGSEWDSARRAISGPLAGQQLKRLNTRRSFWFSVAIDPEESSAKITSTAWQPSSQFIGLPPPELVLIPLPLLAPGLRHRPVPRALEHHLNVD